MIRVNACLLELFLYRDRSAPFFQFKENKVLLFSELMMVYRGGFDNPVLLICLFFVAFEYMCLLNRILIQYILC